MESGLKNLQHRPSHSNSSALPKILAMGGDHSVVLPILRSIHSAYGPIAVLHFDAHMDTWQNGTLNTGTETGLNHGTWLHMAFLEGLMKPNASMVCISIRERIYLSMLDCVLHFLKMQICNTIEI